MNQLGLQLNIPPPVEGILPVEFKGVSTPEHVELFKEAIDVELYPGTKIKQAIFDLSKIDTVNNAAGRILDLACYYHSTCAIPIEVRIPKDIYSDLHEITPKEMPPPSDTPAIVRGVTVSVTGLSREATAPPQLRARPGSLPELRTQPEVVVACPGKIRAINDRVVTVSLWVDGEEVIGEFDRSQFPRKQIAAGMVFDYQALVRAPGKTEILIDFLSVQQATAEELENEAKELRKEFGDGIDRL
jgi:hypothetical protein